MGLQQHQAASEVGHTPPRRDAGFSLVEVLVAITLISITVIPLMLSGIVLLRISGQTHTIAKVESVLSNAADRVNRAGEGCDYQVYVQAAALAEGWEADRASAVYEYYVPADNSPTVLGTWVAGACPGPQRPQGLVQKITITVNSPDDRIQRTIVVVKSDV